MSRITGKHSKIEGIIFLEISRKIFFSGVMGLLTRFKPYARLNLAMKKANT